VGIENAAVYAKFQFFSGLGSDLLKDRDVVLMEKRKPLISIELLLQPGNRQFGYDDDMFKLFPGMAASFLM
jgi:hypothetical protein